MVAEAPEKCNAAGRKEFWLEDYGKFLEEAQQAVLLEEKLRGQETDLKAQTEERQKELAAEEQSLKDSIDRTVTSRRKELAANFDDGIAEERAALKRAQSKKERAKHIGKQERIAAESAPIEEEMSETGRRLRELFRKQQVPGIFRSKLYYALYWPQHFGEWLQILLFVALLFVALPCGIYFLALPDSLRHIPALVLIYIADIVLIGGIYTVIGTQSKLRYLETLKEGRRMRNEIAEKGRELRRVKRSIQRDKSDEPYNLGDFDNEIAAAEQRLEATQQKKAEALRIFDAETADKIAEELRGEAATRINQKKSEYEVAQHALTEVGKERQAAALRLAERYEPMLGKEFMTAEKIAALKDIMENGTVTNLAEAIARYRDRQES